MSSGSSQLAGETSLTDDPPSLFALTKQNFMLRYDTNIPRQVGLAGSSAIVLATLKCLMKFYNITDNDLPKPIRANFILNVETDELFITAGLQDRVVQVYEGLVYMDFSRTLMDEHGYGSYVSMDMGALPPFWLAYLSDPSDSGRIHSNIRQRWLSGEPLVVEAMRTFAELTDQARVALENRDWTTLAQLMDQNFELRRTVYTDECLGPGNLKMVRLAKKFGSAVKLQGHRGGVSRHPQDHSVPGEARGRPDGISAGQRRLLLQPKELAVPPVRLPQPAPADGQTEPGTVLGVAR
ncbi:uncharacterized protein LOC130522405 [Takifugu flavidus]|uniref:uncharacterized protein LOC130522405 n=1 Tax=Takifugu flavidus TaxID=433684 RepID=UPI002543FE2B|nr:uncharacterized protein LOC130522405 [Takifugu flavidus]